MIRDYLSIDIGGTFIKSAYVTEHGKITLLEKYSTPNNLEDFLLLISKIIEEKKEKIAGVGFSSLGKVDINEGKIYNGGMLRFLHELSLKTIIETEFSLPCAVSNDAKSALQAELWLGSLKKTENAAAIILGTGVGGGIVLERKILQGTHFQAGELSLLLREPGSTDIVGFSGSAVRLIENVAIHLGLSDKQDGLKVFEVIKSKKKEEVNKLFGDYCLEIAHVISNLQITLDLDKIIIGGGISEQDILIENISKQYDQIRKKIAILREVFLV